MPNTSTCGAKESVQIDLSGRFGMYVYISFYTFDVAVFLVRMLWKRKGGRFFCGKKACSRKCSESS